MTHATKIDISAIINILTPAFASNLSVNRCVKQDAKRLQRIENQIRYISRISIRNQLAFINSDKTAAALCNLSLGKKATVFDDLYFLFKVSGLKLGLELMKREKLLKQHQPKSQFCHLWFIGVDVEVQGKGIGSKLLNEIKQLCTQNNWPIYLETSNTANLNFYRKNGFELYKQLTLPVDDFELYFFRWMPD